MPRSCWRSFSRSRSLVILYFGDMQGLLIKCAGFTEIVRFAKINFAEIRNGVVSYQLAHKLLLTYA